MNTKVQLQTMIPDEYQGKRIDQVLALLFPEYSRSRLKEWLLNGLITIDEKSFPAKYKVHGGESVAINAIINDETTDQPEDIELDIVYEDEDILVINKPVGLVVHPAAGNRKGTLLNALLHHAPQLKELPRAGIIHRLDKDTSGLLIVAKTLPAYTKLVKMLQKREISREYIAIVQGLVISGGTIDQPIGRHPTQRIKMAIVDSGKPAITHYRIKEKFKHYTTLFVKLETGRTHQIRVHLADIKHPIIGDQTYGGRLTFPKGISDSLRSTIQSFRRQALHAFKLSFEHPISEEQISFEIDLPEDMQLLLTTLKTEDR